MATYRAVLLSLATTGIFIAYLVVLALTPRAARARVMEDWACWWLGVCGRIAGIRVVTHNRLPVPGSFIAPNHLGYADVLALGSVLKCFFVAKRDVEHWPIVGLLFRASGQIGVSRKASKDLLDSYQRMSERLKCGHSICVFLEGTSTGGGQVLAFRGAMLQVAINANAPVVPTAIRWRVRDGGDVAEDVAYWKDHVFVPHVWRLLGLKGIEAEVTFGQPISASTCDRKELAERARAEVIRLLEYPAGA